MLIFRISWVLIEADLLIDQLPVIIWLLSEMSEYRRYTVQAYLVLLCFTLSGFTDTVFFTNWRFTATPRPGAFIHFIYDTLCHILLIPAIFQTFSFYYICCGHLWSMTMTSDVTTVVVLWCYEPHPYKMLNLIDKWVCSDCSTDWPFLHLSPSPWAFLFPETQQHWNYSN